LGVLSISDHGCIRMVKEGLALMNADVPIDFFTRKIASPEMEAHLSSVTKFNSEETFEAKLRNLDMNLMHVHNEPDWIVHRAKSIRPEIPLVYDCHDLGCIRTGQSTPDEDLAMKVADAYIFPSQACMQIAEDYHRIQEDKPRAVVQSMCLESMFIDGEMPRTGGIAYEGGVLAFPAGVPDPGPFAYLDYRPLAVSLTKARIPFTIYSSNNRYMYEYLVSGAVYISRLPYNLMLRELTRHDWGLVGCVEPCSQYDATIPNKLFEYMAAGIPIIVLNADECAEFVMQTGIGVVVNSMDDIPEIYGDNEKYRKKVLEVRGEFTMESQIPTIKALYREVMGR